jgi:hypothetical protein
VAANGVDDDGMALLMTCYGWILQKQQYYFDGVDVITEHVGTLV